MAVSREKSGTPQLIIMFWNYFNLVPDQFIGTENQDPVDSRHSCQIPLPLVQFNTNRNNKNIISYTGVFVLAVIFVITVIIPTSGQIQYGLISEEYSVTNLYIISCCLPVGLGTIYFMREPKHFINVLEHLSWL